MLTLYWICLLVGGFFVALSLFGGDADAGDADLDLDADAEADFDLDADADSAPGAGGFGLSDLLSLRALLLFAAAFGLTGVLLDFVGTGEPLAALLAGLTGAVAAMGGTYAIERVGKAHVSADTSAQALVGRGARVTVPFGEADRGAVVVTTATGRVRLRAESVGGPETFAPGDEVVVVGVEDGVARVVRPGGELPPAGAGQPQRVRG